MSSYMNVCFELESAPVWMFHTYTKCFS